MYVWMKKSPAYSDHDRATAGENMEPVSTCLAFVSLPVGSELGVHLVLGRLEDHTKLALQTGQRVAWWDREGIPLQDPGQEEEELHLCQGLAQTHPNPRTKWQVAGRRDDQTCGFTVQEPTCKKKAGIRLNTHKLKYKPHKQGIPTAVLIVQFDFFYETKNYKDSQFQCVRIKQKCYLKGPVHFNFLLGGI